jgi:uncharacterized protein YprB with RNaseH-like and TPR domain
LNLKSRLSRLQARTGNPGTVAVPQSATSHLRSRLATLRPQRLHTRGTSADSTLTLTLSALAEALGGKRVSEGVIRIQRHIPLAGRLGTVELNALRPDPVLPGDFADPKRRQVYIDTETTGLSGGSGTLAFLIGIAVIGDDDIALTQFLLTGFGAEAAMLSAFAETLSGDDRLVSYNGKSYDLPLLLTRFRMQALSHPLEGLPHLDLLHPVRRLFGSRWSNCRLQTLERNLLGFRRVDDLPGSEAPAAWFDYVRAGHADRLVRVVDHNRQDIISLAVAHCVLARVIDQPRTCDMDLAALARWLAEHDETAARNLLEAHANRLCTDGRRLLGGFYRRTGDWTRAVATWEQLAASGCTDSRERLAKYHEHISKDLHAARRYCNTLPKNAAREHRLRRIDRKMLR